MTLDLLMVNHRDPLHPKAGGAEQVLYEVGKRIARMGRVTWLAESVKGRKEREVLEGIQILRRGNGFTLHLHSIMEARRHDVTIDSVAHAVPFFSHLVNERTLALVHHVAPGGVEVPASTCSSSGPQVAREADQGLP